MSTKGDCVDIGSRDDMRGRQSLHIIWVHNELSENPNVYYTQLRRAYVKPLFCECELCQKLYSSFQSVCYDVGIDTQ